MLSIKLKRVGKRGQASFRVVVGEARSKLGGKFIEDLGWVNPRNNQFKINKERFVYWLKCGAKPTLTAAGYFKKAGIE